MILQYACLPWAVTITALLWVNFGPVVIGAEIKTATACYGNTNNYLRLDCENGAVISVVKVIHGAKLKSEDCKSPASVDTYKRQCCLPHPDDCSLIVQNAATTQCNNKPNCDAVATWSITTKECDQDIYPPATNYMLMAYTCVGGSSSASPGTEEITSSSAVTTPLVTSGGDSTSPSKEPDTTVRERSTQKQTGPAPSDDDELSDAMIGAIVGGSLGMLLTFVAFVFYWGRKRRLRIVSRPQPTVWDYLLNQTFTVRGARGYDQFPSVRSSASSDGEANSPVTAMRRNTWLPNIAPQGADDNEDDASSVYENNSNRLHRVEVHPTATPSPYAILNLDVNVDTSNINQNAHHDA
ncbi:uncharacterized protein LOC101861635 [Aplysia californica]|uniref:Uncharacterized protein LOC101861635 n=1 Tax=Aplysia californica TaxID=6500 RepID=A0ABM0KAM1_APLCA|nr:uncharacterized protein LOC101861635 [Aplysia californica]